MEYLAAFLYCAGLCATQLVLADFRNGNRVVYALVLLFWPVPILSSLILAALEKDQ